jgi:hypothetical protein
MLTSDYLTASGHELSPSELSRVLEEQEKLALELMAREAEKDWYFWLTECTKTQDEQDPINPFKPFPKRPYFKPIGDLILREPVSAIEKSRTMMMSWLVSGRIAHRMFTQPATGVIFQSEDEDRALHDVKNVKTLLEHSIAPLRDRWRIRRENDSRLEIENGSWCLGIVGRPDKIRSEHPTIVVFDEAAHMTRLNEAFGVAIATRCLHTIMLSSAKPGQFEEYVTDAVPVDWPDAA